VHIPPPPKEKKYRRYYNRLKPMSFCYELLLLPRYEVEVLGLFPKCENGSTYWEFESTTSSPLNSSLYMYADQPLIYIVRANPHVTMHPLPAMYVTSAQQNSTSTAHSVWPL
jgi:hypothetical protein